MLAEVTFIRIVEWFWVAVGYRFILQIYISIYGRTNIKSIMLCF